MGYKLRNFYWSYSILVTLFVFSFFTSYGYAAEIQITTNSANQINPSISGNYIVWQDYRNSPSGDPLKNPDIYGYNLLTSSEVTIASEGVFNPDYYIDQLFPFGGEKVVWSATPIGQDSEIYFYNFLNPFPGGVPVTSDSYKQSSPAISGNRIVWEDKRNGNWDIYSRTVNLSNNTFGTETAIVTASGSQNRPRIDGNKVVWTDYRNGYPYPNNNIYFYDFSNPVTNGVPVTSGSYERDKPAVSGNRVVWQDKRNGNWDIYMKDVSSGVETRITTDLYSQINPAIYGNIIVWEDYRAGGNSNIYLYNISNGVETPLTSGDYYHKNPAIYDNKVVWEDGRNGSSDIYLAYLDTTSPTAPTNLSVTPISSTRIDLNWTASTDNVGVVGYRIYRGGLFVGTTTTTSYSDTGLSPSTPYSYQVSAYDSSGNESGKSNMAIVKTNIVPIAIIDSVTPNSAIQGQSVNFIGHGTDSDGTIIGYEWRSSINGQLSTSASFGKSNLSVGTHTIYFKVKDNKGDWSDEVSVILKVIQKPTAIIDSVTPNSANRNQIIAFTGHGTDADGAVTEYLWSFGDSFTSTTQSPTHSYTNPGTYTVSFKVKDNDGLWSSETTTTVTINNQNPTANAGQDQAVDGGTMVNLSGSGTDPDGDTLSYNWIQTAGPAVTLNNPNTANPSFTALGVAIDTVLTFKLTVNDENGGIVTDAINIMVSTLNAIEAWVRRYNVPTNDSDEAVAVALDKAGNIYVTGVSYGSTTTGSDYTTIKYDSSGNELWVRRYNGSGNYQDSAYAIATDGAGNVYVTGFSGGTSIDYTTIKYDTNGNELWVKKYNGPANNSDIAKAITVDGSGNVYVTGYSVVNETDYDATTIKYDTDGNELWVRTYDQGSTNAIVVDGSGNVYVGGASKYDYLTIKYDANGNELWTKIHKGSAYYLDVVRDIAIDKNGNVYVTGESSEIETSYDYTTIKYDTNGNELWVKRYNGPRNSEDKAKEIVVDESSNIYVTGGSYGGTATSYDYATIKYDSSGNELWVKRYNSPTNKWDVANAITLDKAGNIYVTGTSGGNYVIPIPYSGTITYGDYVTIKYDPLGNELWVKRYDGPVNGEDEANDIVVDGVGNVYVTGGSPGSGTNFDYATIKYTQPNNSPTANAGQDQAINENTLVNLSGSGQDPDGDTLSYNWTQTAGPGVILSNPNIANPSFTAPEVTQDTVLTFQLIVNDGKGGTSSDTVNITVKNVNRPPVFDQIDNKTVDEGQLIEFTVSATDLDGDTLVFSRTAGPVGDSFNPGTGAWSWTPAFDQAGSHDVTFEVTDGYLTAAKTVTVNVNNINRSPIANAGEDQTVNENTLVNFSGSGTDPDGDTLSYNWTQTAGSGVVLSNSNIANPSFISPEVTQDTTLTFELTVNDGKGGINLDTVNITVKNVNTQTGTNVTVNPENGPNGMVLIFDEVTNSGMTSVTESGSNPTPSPSGFNFLGSFFDITTDAVYAGKIKITIPYDETKVIGSEADLRLFHYENGEWKDVTVLPVDTANNKITGEVASLSPFIVGQVNQNPTANAGPDQTVNEGTIVILSGSMADPDGNSLTYNWSQPVGLSNPNTLNPSFAVPQVDTDTILTFELTVSDGNGGTNSDEVSVTIKNVNKYPTAILDSVVLDPAIQNQTVNFTGHGNDADGTITEYFWGFGDGATSTAQNPTHAYGSTGTYNVTFKVRDNNGDWSFEVSRLLTVNASSSSGGSSPLPSNGGGGGGSPAPSIQSVDPTGKIRGRIISISGLAVLGTPARIGNTSVATNLNGEFEFLGLSDGIYTVYYEADGYISQTQVLQVSNGGTTVAPTVIMSPNRPTGRIKGRIINTSGIPILGIPVRINNIRMATNLNGEFEFTFVADGIYTLFYEAPGYITQSQVLPVINGGTTTAPTVVMSPVNNSISAKSAKRRIRRVRRRR